MSYSIGCSYNPKSLDQMLGIEIMEVPILNQYSEWVSSPRPKANWELTFRDWVKYIRTRVRPVTTKSYFD